MRSCTHEYSLCMCVCVDGSVCLSVCPSFPCSPHTLNIFGENNPGKSEMRTVFWKLDCLSLKSKEGIKGQLVV